jgi:hypothetical protein
MGTSEIKWLDSARTFFIHAVLATAARGHSVSLAATWGGEQDPLIRLSAWRVLVPQPIDLSGDLIRHLPAEFNIGVLMLMADWFPLVGSPLPEGFWGALEQSIISLFRPCLQPVCFERSGEICSPVATGTGRRNPGCVVYVEKYTLTVPHGRTGY